MIFSKEDIDKAYDYIYQVFKNDDNKYIKIEPTKARKQRTISQHNLYRLWIRVFADVYGDSDLDYVSTIVKRHILGVKDEKKDLDGNIVFVDYRTSDFDKKEMSEFMSKFKVFAQTEYNTYLPYYGDPGYNELIEYYRK